MKPWKLRLAVLAATATVLLAAAGGAEPLHVVATTPDLGSLIETIGGADVELTTLVKGPQDPHAIEPRPSFIAKLHRADLLVLTGMELEQGWVPPLLRSARNPEILPGGPAYVDASRAIRPLELPAAGTDRSMGDVHPYGNPHYLTDPIRGVRVAALLRERLAAQRPEAAEGFAARFDAFERETAERLAGASLVAAHGAGAVLAAAERGDLAGLAGGDAPDGWLGSLPRAGTLAVEDHQFYGYFAERFGLVLVGRLEPQPGIAPTTRHLGEVVGLVEARAVPVILASAYFDPRHARWVAERTDAQVVPLAHQPGARAGTPDYLGTIDYNVRALAAALRGAPKTR
jgi:ABC-type Zn uptake system ZnuABC Zn-binding protein ZnuA